MISYFKIQAGLAVAISTLVLAFHFSVRVAPELDQPLSAFEPARALPYVAAALSVVTCMIFARDRRRAYENFLQNSPGVEVDTTGVAYGPGHTVDQ